MSLTPRSQIRLAAVTGSLTAISDVANQSLSAGSRLEPAGAEAIGATNLEGILGQLAASIKRIQGDGEKDFTEVTAGVFTHDESRFIGVISGSSDLLIGGHISGSGDAVIGGDLQVIGNDIKSSTGDVVISLSNDDATFSDQVSVLGNLDVGSSNFTVDSSNGNVYTTGTLETDGLATLAQAKVEDLNVSGGLVFTDATGRLDNDQKVTWNGSQFAVDGIISGSGNIIVGGNITGSSMLLNGDLAVNGGDITTTSATFNLLNSNATTVNFAGGATSGVNIGSAASDVTIAGDLRINGNDIKSSAGSTVITLGGTTATAAGDFIVSGSTYLGNASSDVLFVTASAYFAQPVVINGNQISGSAGGNITLQSGGNVVIAGDLEIDGNEIKSSTGETVITLSANDATFADQLGVTGNFSVATNKFTVDAATGNTAVAGTLDIVGKTSGSTAQFSGEMRAATVKVDSLIKPGVVIAGDNGLLTTTASLFYTENRLEVSSSVRVSGDMAVNGEGGVADITSTAVVAAIFDSNVDTIYFGGDAEIIQVGEQGGLVDFAGDMRMTGTLEMMGAGEEFIDRKNGGSLVIRGGELTGSVGKVKVTISGSDLRFDDGYRAGWDNDIKLAGSYNDWNRFKNVFGEASILQAITNAAALPSDAKFMFKILPADSGQSSLSGDKLKQVGGAHFSGSYLAVPSGSRNENVDVFLNGQLLVSKSYDEISYDYDITPNGQTINFNFDLQEDDFLSILVPQTMVSVADYVQASGAAIGGGGSGSGAYDIAASMIGKPAASEVILRLSMGRNIAVSSGYAYCETAPTAQAVFGIQKGVYSSGNISYSSVGSITFAIGEKSATVTLSTPTVSLSAGDIIRVVAPASPDSTLASPTVTLTGVEA